MKNKTKLFILFVIAWVLIGLTIGVCLYLDLYYNHRYSRADDNPKPEPVTKTLNTIECEAFIAVEIGIGADRIWFITPKQSRRNSYIVQQGVGQLY